MANILQIPNDFYYNIEKILWSIRNARSETSTTNVGNVMVSTIEHIQVQNGMGPGVHLNVKYFVRNHIIILVFQVQYNNLNFVVIFISVISKTKIRKT